MKTYTHKLNIRSEKQFEIINITPKVAEAIKASGIASGVVNIFTSHTTAAIKINHHEPLLLQDLMKTLYRLVPADMNYGHDLFELKSGIAAEERSNGHAHVKAFLLGASETVPVDKSKMLLGQRQSIFLVELDGPRPRTVIVTVCGE